MGNLDILVTIDGLTYTIEDCPNDCVAVTKALKLHKEYIDKQNKYYRENKIKDVNGTPMSLDYDTQIIFCSRNSN